MPYQLLICEKPSAAAKIALALGSGRVERRRINGVPTFWLNREGRELVVVSALGHLFSVVQRGSGWSFPVFDIEWAPIYKADPKAKRTRYWIQAISELSKGADSFVSACDFDTEGSLIAYMILKYACRGADTVAERMKFSTLTREDLLNSYKDRVSALDFNVIAAGKTRHELDWIFGINVSRALMDAVNRNCGRFQILSAGRVQSPTLSILQKRELSINLHVPDPYWTIGAEALIQGKKFGASYMLKEILSREKADAVVRRCDGSEAVVSNVSKSTVVIPPPYPFDLTSLQREAYRILRFTPSGTQKLAEKLYLGALISYPRTSSQRLPPSLGLGGILKMLLANPRYKLAAGEILSSGRPLRPREGPKADQAHPAIHPTGKQPPKGLGRQEAALYDLIVRRFLATFGEWASKEITLVTLGCGNEDKFSVRGEEITQAGWMNHYMPNATPREGRLPGVTVGEHATMAKVWKDDRYSSPPPRFNPSSILSLMDRNKLGTKSTRAEVLDTLYRRGYVEGVSIRVTELGLAVVPVLRRFFPELVRVDLTKRFTGEMEGIERGNKSADSVISGAVEELKPFFDRVISKHEEVGGELSKALRYLDDSRRKVGMCPSCKDGELIIVYSKKTRKRFLGCSNYSKGCRFSLPLPQRGRIRTTKDVCMACGLPIIEVGGLGTRPWRICVNDKCPSKH